MVTLGGSAMLLGGCLLCKRSGPKRGRLADRARSRRGSKGKAMMRVDTTENGRAESQEAEMYELNAAAQEAWTWTGGAAARSSDEWDPWKDLRQTDPPSLEASAIAIPIAI